MNNIALFGILAGFIIVLVIVLLVVFKDKIFKTPTSASTPTQPSTPILSTPAVTIPVSSTAPASPTASVIIKSVDNPVISAAVVKSNTATAASAATSSAATYPNLPIGSASECPAGYTLYGKSCIKGTACEQMRPYKRTAYTWKTGDKKGDYTAAGLRCMKANPKGCDRVLNTWYPKCAQNYTGVVDSCVPNKACTNITTTPSCKTGVSLGGYCYIPCNSGYTLSKGMCTKN